MALSCSGNTRGRSTGLGPFPTLNASAAYQCLASSGILHREDKLSSAREVKVTFS